MALAKVLIFATFVFVSVLAQDVEPDYPEPFFPTTTTTEAPTTSTEAIPITTTAQMITTTTEQITTTTRSTTTEQPTTTTEKQSSLTPSTPTTTTSPTTTMRPTSTNRPQYDTTPNSNPWHPVIPTTQAPVTCWFKKQLGVPYWTWVPNCGLRYVQPFDCYYCCKTHFYLNGGCSKVHKSFCEKEKNNSVYFY